MNNRIKDITGQTFGRLTVIKHAGFDSNRHSLWLCKCQCGNEKVISNANLGRNTFSCGCLHKETAIANLTPLVKSGDSRTSLYHKWYDLNHREGKHYIGITVCPEWSAFEDCQCTSPDGKKLHNRDRVPVKNENDEFTGWINFRDWFFEQVEVLQHDKIDCDLYGDLYQIHRIDSTKGYSPDNCIVLQNPIHNILHRSKTVIVAYGMALNTYEWSVVFGTDSKYFKTATPDTFYKMAEQANPSKHKELSKALSDVMIISNSNPLYYNKPMEQWFSDTLGDRIAEDLEKAVTKIAPEAVAKIA